MKYPNAIRITNDKLSIVSGGIIMLIGCFSIVEVVCRGFFNSPTKWTADINQYLLIWAIFLVAGYAFQAHGHVRVDILTRKLTIPAQRVLSIISHLICLCFVVIFTKSCFDIFYKAYTGHMMTYAFIQIPKWILMIAMLIGCALMITTLISIIIDLIGKGEKFL